MKLAFLGLILSMMFIDSVLAKSAKPIGEEFWFSAGYEYKFSKDFSINYTNEQRFELNNDEEKSIYNEVKPSYEILKDLTIDAGFRLRTKVENTNPEYISSLTYKYTILDFDLSGRLRYHKKIENDNATKDYLRVKFILKHEIIKDLNIKVQTEYFYRFLYDNGDRFDKNRSGLELDWEFVKNWDLSAFWLYENEFNTKKPTDTRVFGISLSFEFK